MDLIGVLNLLTGGKWRRSAAAVQLASSALKVDVANLNSDAVPVQLAAGSTPTDVVSNRLVQPAVRRIHVVK